MPKTAGSLNQKTLDTILLAEQTGEWGLIHKDIVERYRTNYEYVDGAIRKKSQPTVSSNPPMNIQSVSSFIDTAQLEPDDVEMKFESINPADDLIDDIPFDPDPASEERQARPAYNGDAYDMFAQTAGMNIETDHTDHIDNTDPWDAINNKLTEIANEEAEEAAESILPQGGWQTAEINIQTEKIHVPNLRVSQPEEVASIPQTSTPKYGDPNWTEYVLDQLVTGREAVRKDGGLFPKNAGLKRMVEKYVGTIIRVEPTILATPNRDNHGIWVIQAYVVVRKNNSEDILEWSDVGNVFASSENQSDLVTLNPLTSAYTMALSRCYKNLLGLAGVHSSEELDDKGTPIKPHDPDAELPLNSRNSKVTMATDRQKTHITKLCIQHNLNAMQVVHDTFKDNSYKSLNDLTKAEADQIASVINDLQNSRKYN